MSNSGSGDSGKVVVFLIGKNGATIKRIGIVARKIISKFSNQKVFIKLSVEVDKNWHTNENSIKKYLDIKGN